MKKYIFILIIFLGFSGTANAEPNIYIGVGVGFSSFGGDALITVNESSKLIIDDKTYEAGIDFSGAEITAKAFLGIRFFEYSAIEIAFHRFGGPTGRINEGAKAIFNEAEKAIGNDDSVNDVYNYLVGYETIESFDVLGASASLLGIIPVTDNIDVFAKVGILHSWLSSDYSFEETGFSVLLGGGATIKITESVSLRAELEWAPDIANNHSIEYEMALNYANAELKKIVPNAGKLDYDVDLDILSTTVSLVWNF